jgi:hypothetical protein
MLASPSSREPAIVPHFPEGLRMNFIVTFSLLVLGGILLTVGFESTEAIHDEASRVVIARYSERTIWFMVSGSLCFVIGLVGIFRTRRA